MELRLRKLRFGGKSTRNFPASGREENQSLARGNLVAREKKTVAVKKYRMPKVRLPKSRKSRARVHGPKSDRKRR